MQDVLPIIVPVFTVIALGFISARGGLLDDLATTALNRYVFYVAAPCLILPRLLAMELPALTPWGFLAGYYGATFTMFALGMLISRLALQRRLQEQAMDGFGCAYSNMVLMGIPLVLSSLGEDATLPLFLLLGIHSLLLFTTTTIFIELDRGHRDEVPATIRRSLLGLGRNPIILTMAAGLCGNVAGLALPALALDSLRFVGDSTPPCALFALGLSLGQARIRNSLVNASFMVPVKNILHPLLVAVLVTRVFTVAPLWQKTAILLAAMPTGANVYLFARHYGINEAQLTSAIVVSTATSLVTVTVLLGWMR